MKTITNIIYPALAVFTLVCFPLAPVAQAAPSPKPEDRGNGNSAAENVQALNLSTTGGGNTAHGWYSLRVNTTGANNTATGFGALMDNTTGHDNTAIGVYALSGGGGANNTAAGVQALQGNPPHTGVNNTAIGQTALLLNTTGSNNTANGRGALINNTTGSNNVALGADAGSGVSTASNIICIGASVGGANVSNTTWIGNVYGNATLNGQTAPVIVSVDGQLATVVSSERFKKDVATMEKASEAILSLHPVIFHYKTDTTGTPQFGLIAEEVAKVNPALVLPDKEGKPYTVRYDAVNAMLLNEFLKARHQIDAQQKQIDALTAGLQKVSAQLELIKPAPQTVVNNQ